MATVLVTPKEAIIMGVSSSSSKASSTSLLTEILHAPPSATLPTTLLIPTAAASPPERSPETPAEKGPTSEQPRKQGPEGKAEDNQTQKQLPPRPSRAQETTGRARPPMSMDVDEMCFQTARREWKEAFCASPEYSSPPKVTFPRRSTGSAPSTLKTPPIKLRIPFKHVVRKSETTPEQKNETAKKQTEKEEQKTSEETPKPLDEALEPQKEIAEQSKSPEETTEAAEQNTEQPKAAKFDSMPPSSVEAPTTPVAPVTSTAPTTPAEPATLKEPGAFNWENYLKANNATAAPKEFFFQNFHKLDNQFQLGHKLVMPDPRSLGSNCLGSVVGVHRSWVCIRLDGEDTSNDHWVVCDDSQLAPIRGGGEGLQPPIGFTRSPANFRTFVKKKLAEAEKDGYSYLCPKENFKPIDSSLCPTKNLFRVGMKLELVERRSFNGSPCVVTVADVNGDMLTLSFDGSTDHTAKEHFQSRYIYPCGWGELNDAPVAPPKEPAPKRKGPARKKLVVKPELVNPETPEIPVGAEIQATPEIPDTSVKDVKNKIVVKPEPVSPESSASPTALETPAAPAPVVATPKMNKRSRLPVDSCDETSVNSPPRKEAKAHNGARIELIPESSREARAAATLGHASACTSSVVFSSAAPPQIAVSSTTTTSSKQQKSPSVAAALQQALVSTSSAEQEKSPVEKSPTPKANLSPVVAVRRPVESERKTSSSHQALSQLPEKRALEQFVIEQVASPVVKTNSKGSLDSKEEPKRAPIPKVKILRKMNGTAMISSSVSTPSHSLSPPVAPPVDHDRELMPPPAITKVKRKAQKEARRAAKRQAKAEKAEKAARAELVQAQLDQLVAAQAMASETKTSEDNVDGEPPRKIIKKILFKEPTLPASPVFARAPVSIFVPSKKTPEVVLPPPLAMMSLAPALPKVDSLKVAEPLVVHPKPVDKKPTLPEETDLAPGCSGSPSSSVIPTKPTLVVEPKATPAAQSKPISITPPKPPVFLLKPVEQKPTLPKTGSSYSSDDQPKPTPTAQPKIPVVQSQPLQQEPKLPEAVSDRSGFASFSALQPKPSDIFQAKPSSTAQPKPPVVEQPKPVKQKTTMPEAVPGPSGLAYSSAVQPKPKATSIVQPKPVNAAQSKPLEQKPNLTEAVPSCSGLARSLTVQPKASPVIQLKETSTAQQLPVVHSKPADQKTKMPEPVLGPSGLASSSAIHSKSATAAQPKPPAVQPKPVKQKPTLPSAKPKAPKATAPEPKPAVAKPQAEVEIINAPGKEPNAKAVAAANAMSPRSTPADGVREDVVIIPKDIRGVAPSLMLFINHGCARQSEYMDIRKIQTIQKKVGPSSAHHLLREVMQGLVNAASYLHLAHVYRKIPQGPHGGHLNITCSVGNMTYLRYLPTPGTVPGVVTVIRDFLKDVNVCPNFVSTSGQECPNCRRVFRRDPPAQPLEFESWDVETMGEYAQGIVGGNIKESFIEHGIDGQALKWLTMEQIRSMLHLQLGPALKLFHLKDTFERSQHQNVPQPQPL